MKYPPRVLWRAAKYRFLQLFGGRDYVPFLILSRSRTGSNLLNSYLGGHPNVRVKGEHFGWLKGDSIEKRDRQIYSKQPRHIRAAGCKVFYYHPHDGDQDALFAVLRAKPELRVIHLKRRDVVRSSLSWFLARHNDRYVATSDQELLTAEKKRITIHPDEFIHEIRKTRGWEEQGPGMFPGKPMMDIYYEDLVSEPEREFGRVLRFLDLPPHRPQTYLVRQNPESIQALVANYAELEARLKAEFPDLVR